MQALRAKVVVPLVLLTAGGVGAWLILGQPPAPTSSESAAQQTRAAGVRVVELQPQNHRFVIRSRGTVRPRTQSNLAAEISGRIVWVSDSFEAGGFFQTGEPLVRLDQREYELRIVQLTSELERARVALLREKERAAVARREWNELRSQTKGEPGPLALRGPQVEQAEASLEAAQASLDQAQLNLSRTVVEAPYDGRVRETLVDVGQFVNRGSPLASVFSVDYAEINLPIPDDRAVFVNLPLSYSSEASRNHGPAVTIIATFQNRRYRFPAKIVRTQGELDPETHVIHAIARVEDPYKRRGSRPPLVVGMFVEAEIQGKTIRDAYLVPRAAFVERDVVMTVDEQDRLRLTEVVVERTEGDTAVVSDGLEPGARVIVSPLETPVDGMRVEIESAESSPNDATVETTEE